MRRRRAGEGLARVMLLGVAVVGYYTGHFVLASAWLVLAVL